MSTIAFLGIGAMGSRMAKNLIAANHQVTIWNRSPRSLAAMIDQDAMVATSPAAAVKDAELVISMVRDDEASRYVWLDRENGALSSMPKNSIAIECSTLSPGWVRELAETARDTGIGFVDAPVAGSRPQAEAAQLVFFAGTDEATYHSVHPVLSSMGSVVHYCGPTGTGATIKLAVNALFAVQVATVAEVMGLLERTFPDLSKAFEIIGSTPVCSTAARLAGQAMLSRRFDPAFPIELVEKDLDYVESLALGVKAELPISSLTHQLMKNGISEGFGDDNITGIAQLYME